MNADSAAKEYCKGCRNFKGCKIPCTTVLVTLWDELGGKTTIGEMQDLMQKARKNNS